MTIERARSRIIDIALGFTHLAEASYRFEEPDLMVTVLTATLTFATVDGLCVACERWAREKPYFLALTELSGTRGTPSPATRKRGADTLRMTNLRGAAFVGGTSRTRAFSAMVFRGIALLSSRARAAPVRFFATEAEARAWLVERRAEIQQEEARGKLDP